LAQLTVVIDRNGLQSLTTTEQTLALEPLGDKWRAFGWEVETVNGHNHDELRRALRISGARPRCVIAETVKGHGVSFMENQVEWHYRPPSDDDLNEALRLLERGEGR
jgi:transketolase